MEGGSERPIAHHVRACVFLSSRPELLWVVMSVGLSVGQSVGQSVGRYVSLWRNQSAKLQVALCGKYSGKH